MQCDPYMYFLFVFFFLTYYPGLTWWFLDEMVELHIQAESHVWKYLPPYTIAQIFTLFFWSEKVVI